jgi:hypothetical protein
MVEPPRHHVLQREFREWFEKYGFTGEMSLWTSFTPETHKERVGQARAALRATPPPPGWRPLGPDDELLRTLLPDEEV